MKIRVMESPAISTEDAFRRSLPLFRKSGNGTERRAFCWPCGGRWVWILETTGVNDPLCDELVLPRDALDLDYHYAETAGPDDVPVPIDFHPVLRRWLRREKLAPR